MRKEVGVCDRNTFVTVTSDRKEGKSGLLLANIAYVFSAGWLHTE